MKVTVCINDTKIVVPCGDGDLSVRQLAELAIIRYRKTVLAKASTSEFVEINSLKLARDGGILDWDDKVHDVLDDRDLLIAQNSSTYSVVNPCPPSTLASPPLPHHSSRITGGDVINCNLSTSNLFNICQPVVSTNQNVPTIFSSSVNHDRFSSRHNSIPCSDQEIHRNFGFDGNKVVSARHESLDDILDSNNPDKMLNNYTLSKDYERWPLPPFPMGSTLQSSTEMTVIPKNISSNLQDSDDQTWDNSPNDCDEEDYPRLRPDYIVKHLENNKNKSLSGNAPSHQVLQWLESQDCNSVSSSGGGGVGALSYEVGSDIKESESNHIQNDVLEDRNNNRIHASSSSVSSGNDQNRMKEESSPLEEIFIHLKENSITVKLINPKTGENLGIQITPAYLQASLLDQNYLNRLNETEQKSIYGIEVHSIMPKGRVAKERQLNKGDKIIQINDASLIGMAYEKSEALFREALTKTECKLRVIPFQYPTILNLPIQTTKSNPPPPPRRSPNTALSKGKPNVPSSSGSSEKGVFIAIPQQPSKSPISSVVKSANSKMNPALLPPSQQNPVASWTSGLGSMVHTPASSTSSVSAIEKKKLDKTTFSEALKTELIELTKIGSGFGFSITGKDNLPPTIPSAVYVRHILPDGAAIKDGRLKSGDRLLEVDGLLLDGMSQSEVIALLREKPSGSRVKLLVERNPIKMSSQCSASHDSLMTSVSEIDEEGSTLSKNKRNTIKLQFDIPLNDCNYLGEKTNLGISVKVEPNWDRANITQFSSKEDIAASNIVWVKTVIENGAAYKHGKLMVGDQLLEINNQTLSGLESEEALKKLKNIIKEAQESDDGIVHVIVLRKFNMARSSSLNTLNSMTGSGSANSFMPFYDPVRSNLSHKLPNDHQMKNIPPSVSQHDAINSEFVPNPRLALDLPNFNATKFSNKSTKRSAPVPPFCDSSQPDICQLDKTPKCKPAPPPPPPPLARRLKKPEPDPEICQTNISSTFTTSTDFITTTSGLACNSNVSTSSSSANHIFTSYSKSKIFNDSSVRNDIPFSLESNSTTNTLCRNKETSQLILRSRNTRSNCSYTPTKDILHLDDIDWEKMELIPFANCEFSSRFTNAGKINSSSQPAIDQESQSKKYHENVSTKRRGFKKFSISQLFKSRHTNYHKPANSAGSSPIAIRKQSDNTNNKSSTDSENQLPTAKSSHSLKSTEVTAETEYPYAELDFGSSPYSITSDKLVPIVPLSNIKITNPAVSNLLPLPEESFSFVSNHSSEESDSYEDFEDVQSVFPSHLSAVQRIAAAMPKQPSNRFVYEDAEELFQSLQANVSIGQDTLSSDLKPILPMSTFKFQSFDNNEKSSTKDVYQNTFNISGLCLDSTTTTTTKSASNNSSDGLNRLNTNVPVRLNQNRAVIYNINNNQFGSLSDPRQMYLNVQSIPK